MTSLEWAQLFSTIGFTGYSIVVALTLISYIRTNTVADLRRLLVASSLFLVLIGLVAATGALTRPPFEWITQVQSATITGFYVWLSFFVILAGSIRRD